jgi:hypothetical protein
MAVGLTEKRLNAGGFRAQAGHDRTSEAGFPSRRHWK